MRSGSAPSLQYVPGRFASTDELVALASVASRYGGIYISHQRSESAQIDASLDEVFSISPERAKIPAEVWHLKTAYKANWGRMPAVLERLRGRTSRGLDVTANMYPYDRASNGLDACLPIWVREGGLDPMLAAPRTIQRSANASRARWTTRTSATGRTSGTAPAARQA